MELCNAIYEKRPTYRKNIFHEAREKPWSMRREKLEIYVCSIRVGTFLGKIIETPTVSLGTCYSPPANYIFSPINDLNTASEFCCRPTGTNWIKRLDWKASNLTLVCQFILFAIRSIGSEIEIYLRWKKHFSPVSCMTQFQLQI